jgi:signal transduction histidine kinase
VTSPALPARADADVARAPPLPALWMIGFAGCAAAASTVALALASEGSPDPLVRAITVDFIMLPYILAGLVAWWRRPESRFGPLMVAAGFAAFLSHLSWTSLALPLAIDVPYTIGWVASLLPPVLFLHVFLAFPSGRLQRPFERALVTAAYVTAIGSDVVVMMLSDLGPHNLIGVATESDVALTVRRAALVCLSGFSLAGFAVLVARRRGGGRPLRRSLALLIDAFALALVAISVLLIASIIYEPSEMEAIRRSTYAVIGIAPFAFLFVLLRARLARTALGDLLVELRADPQPADLRAALARALGDPSLTLAYWLPQFGSWADLDGRSVRLPTTSSGRATTLIDRDGTHVAALLHDPALGDEPELLDAATAAAGIALENGRLQVELRARVEELHGSRLRILDAGQEERKRLERNLHDGAQQRLVALSLELSLLEERLGADADACALVAQARREIAASLDELREVAHGLHPAVVSAHGLAVALERLATRAPVPVRLSVNVDGRLPEPLEVAAYYLVAESLANVGKYAQASLVTVEVTRSDGAIVVELFDDGIGGADTEGGSGLRGLADRVEALDGRLQIWSPRGGGTRVRAEIPCAP